MKLLVTATVSAQSSGDLQQTKMALLKALDTVKERTNNGSEIKIGHCNADDPAEVQVLMGKVKWFSLGKEPDGFSEHKRQASKKRRAGIAEESEESIDDILLDF